MVSEIVDDGHIPHDPSHLLSALHAGELLQALADACVIDAEFARHRGAWLLGSGYSIADPYAFVLCRWTRGFNRPARTLPHLKPWLDRMLARPSLQRAFATEQLGQPFV